MDGVVARHALERRVVVDAVSEVWHARHVERPTQRATIRIFDLARAPDLTRAVASFLTEARAASAIVHRNVVRSYEVGDPREPYVLSRYTPGDTWSAHVRHGMDVDAALALLAPIASALDAAAAAGVPHGAVHPRTIWVVDDDTGARSRRAVVAGFGLHHLLTVVAARRDDSQSVDDFLYVAPELLRGGMPSNHSDQYSLAAALFHAVAGRPPYEREHLSALFGAHLFGRSPDVVLNDRADAALQPVLTRALSKSPDDRYETCEDFITAAASACGSTPAPSDGVMPVARHDRTKSTAVTPLPEAVAHRPRRVPVPLVPVLAVVAVLVGVASLFWLSRSQVVRDVSALTAAQATAAADPQAPAAEAEDTAVAWEQRLDARATALHMTDEGLAAVVSSGAILLDADTGAVRSDLTDAGVPTAFAAGDRFVTTEAGDLRAVSVADGTVLWEVPVNAAAPTVAGDTVYGVHDDTIPQLVATDADSGERLWEFPRDEVAFPADATISAVDDFVYLADGTALYGILPEGAMVGADTPLITASEAADEPLCLWRHEVDEDMWTDSLRATDRGVVIANRSGTVCLRRHTDGEALWCVPVRGAAVASPTLHTSQDQVFVATPQAITAIDLRSGERLWTQTGTFRQTALADDRLVALDDQDRVIALSPTDGALAYPVDTMVRDATALAVDDDALYVGRRDGTVRRLDLAMAMPD